MSRIYPRILVALLAGLFLSAQQGRSQSWDFPTIWGVNVVHDITVGRATGTTDLSLYFADRATICKSTNSSGSWNTTAAAGDTVLALTCKANDPSILLVAIDKNVRRSTNGGASWQGTNPINAANSLHPLRMATSPVQPSNMYLGARKATVTSSMRRSIDAGSSWNGVTYFQDNAQTDVTCFGMHPADEQFMWAGGSSPANLEPWSSFTTTRENGIFFSTDAGVSWDSCGALRKDIIALAVSYVGGATRLYAATTDSSNKLYQANSHGSTTDWTVVSSYPGGFITDLACKSDTLYVAAENGFYLYANGTWSARSTGVFGTPSRVQYDPLDGTRIYLGTSNNLFKSTNAGNNWSETTGGTPSTSIAMKGGVVLGVSSLYPYLKRYDGSSWTTATLDGFQGRSVSFKSTSGATAFASGSRNVSGTLRASLWRSTDSGNGIWTEVDSGSGTGRYNGFAADPLQSERVYVYGSRTTTQNIRLSTNGGTTFVSDASFKVNSNTLAPEVSSLVIDPTGGGTDGSNYMFAAVSTGNTYDGIWRSSNAGASWTQLTSTLVNGKRMNVLALNPANASIIYAGGQDSLLMTTDQGNTWKVLRGIAGPFTRILMNPANASSARDIFVLAENGNKVYRTRNAGINWENVTFSLPTQMNDLVSDQVGQYKLAAAQSQGPYTLLLTTVPATGTISVTPLLGWNMVSIPNVVANYDSAAVYPSPQRGSSVFQYQSGYVAVKTLANGVGYYVKFNSTAPIPYTGDSIKSMWVPVISGWNIAGTITDDVAIPSLQYSTGLTRTSQFFEWNNGYIPLDNTTGVLRPGKGYWVSFNSAGFMNLRGTQTVGLGRPGSGGELEGFDRFTITDANGFVQDLYVCNADLPDAPGEMEMPPAPPEPEFYAHFESGHFLRAVHADSEDVVLNIAVDEASYPVTLTYEINPDNGITYSFGEGGGLGRVSGEAKRSVVLNSGERIIHLTAKAQLTKTPSSLPVSFSLAQNYPNPFNPTTRIHYELPQDALVHLVVYDILGREVKTLVNETKIAGRYNVNFSTEGQASGVYFYSIQAGSFVSVKKMLLMK